jgi:Putative Ig domain
MQLSHSCSPAFKGLLIFICGVAGILDGCGGASGSTGPPVTPPALSIGTGSLGNGQVGQAYTATLMATGGTMPYHWTMSGTLPAGLTFNVGTGTINGTPTTAVSSAPLMFTVSDSSNPVLTKSVSLTLTITAASAPGLNITTTTLPNATVNVAYSANLAATGGITPYTWVLTSGTLPAGLTLTQTNGSISGTPTASVANTPLKFSVTDSSNPAATASVNLSLTIAAANNSGLSISPKRAGLTVLQALSLTATTSDAQGVTWTATGANCSGNACGTFSSVTAPSTTATYTAPSGAGVYTITATGVTDVTSSTSITVGVTDLAGVYTWHNNLSRDGSNTQEYALTPSLVTTATFGRLFTCTLDAAAYAQPLWVANVSINGGTHNVIYAVTQHDTIYAFDADASPCQTLATKSLLGTGETWVSNSDVGTGDITPDIGIVGTPVIDPATNTIYLVTKSKVPNGSNFFQRLHAVSGVDFSEKPNSPVTIATGGTGSFALIQNQRCGLVLSGSSVYVTWASHGDIGPYHGYVYQYDKTSLSVGTMFNDTPSGSDGGIWMSGAAPAADSSGNLYMITGNGDFNVSKSQYGDTFLKLSSSLAVSDYFTPTDQSSDQSSDADFGSGGAAVLINSANTTIPNLAVGGGKDGALYVLNRDNMGQLGDGNAHQRLLVGGGIFSTAAFWQGTLFLAPAHGALSAYPLNTSTSMFNATSSQTGNAFGWPGSTPSVSSQGATNGIIWAIENTSPAVLHAYDPTNLTTEFWNSSQGTGNQAGTYVKFTVPTVANGKVYVGNSSQITVYGLLPN